ncbi:MAG: hypothetical protein M3Y82_06980 [Verrucomicrobiota bacterium]|nr:hypothetical protein [Verrucomicrobiota bacterium]
MFKILSISFRALLFLSVATSTLAWDYEGHRIVNQLALASLPTNFPAFVKTAAAQERIAFLAGEPDRWRNSPDMPLRHFNAPDHFLDLDDLGLFQLTPGSVSHFRYEFVAQLAVARAAHPQNFPPIDPAKNEDHTRQFIGFLPWTITEYYGKLKSGFSYLKTFATNGTPQEIANAQQNIIYIMGVMGHFAGDAGQPLHTTKNFNGWVDANPNHFTTNKTFHGWVDGGYIHKVGINFAEIKPRVRPAQMLAGPTFQREDIFPTMMSFLVEQHKLVEPLYQLNKEGSLSDMGEADSKGRPFITQQLLKSGQLLGDLWFSAWQTAPIDTYLKSSLVRRKLDPAQNSSASPK